MLYQLRNLTESDREAVIQGPLRVALLIAGSDGEFTAAEAERIHKVVHVKTYSEKSDVHEIYELLEQRHTLSEVNAILAELPVNWTERSLILSEELAKLGRILKKLDHVFALQYYASLKSVAVNVANAGGGVFGLGAIGDSESDLISLPMIEKP